jgi:predicted aminopeptidase
MPLRRRWARVAAIGLALLALAGVSGCADLGYLTQSVSGHLELLEQARPIDAWLADPATPAPLRARLRLAQQLREFAVTDLHLPDNASYRRYADLHRSAAVWNVVAAPELSLTLKTWCYPIFGCAGYRGYFDRTEADQLAQQLRTQGWEVTVYGVPAYSTLGWSNWLGGDPLLNTFVLGPEAELARLIFHELAHQEVYARGDTTFNESFATTVERVGLQRWEAATDRSLEDPAAAARRQDFRALTGQTRDALLQLYRSDLPDSVKRARKAELMARMRQSYAELKAGRWGGYAGYDAWFAHANNASLGLLATYDSLVPAFERLLARCGGDLARFYAEVRRIADLPPAQRQATLDAP